MAKFEIPHSPLLLTSVPPDVLSRVRHTEAAESNLIGHDALLHHRRSLEDSAAVYTANRPTTQLLLVSRLQGRHAPDDAGFVIPANPKPHKLPSGPRTNPLPTSSLIFLHPPPPSSTLLLLVTKHQHTTSHNYTHKRNKHITHEAVQSAARSGGFRSGRGIVGLWQVQ